MSTRLLDAEAIYGLIPHRAAMRLLDTVTVHDETTAEARAVSHLAVDNPLRVDGYLATFQALEYAAQAIAVHGLATFAGGGKADAVFIGAFRDVTLGTGPLDAVPGVPLDIALSLTAAVPGGWSYEFNVSVGTEGELIEMARGRVVVVVPGEKQ